jgi:hypothetical protein
MSLRTATESALKNVEVISRREFRVAVLVCLTVATLNGLYVAYRIGYFDGRMSSGSPYISSHQDISHDVMRLRIEFAFLAAGIALWSRRIIGLWVALIATLFIEIQYAVWYLDTRRWLREMQITDFSQLPVPGEWKHFGGLSLATPWDILLFAFATTLFAWQVSVVVALIVTARRRR